MFPNSVPILTSNQPSNKKYISGSGSNLTFLFPFGVLRNFETLAEKGRFRVRSLSRSLFGVGYILREPSATKIRGQEGTTGLPRPPTPRDHEPYLTSPVTKGKKRLNFMIPTK